jgi:alpha-beta hydrolase superfamily lysophospholipase
VDTSLPLFLYGHSMGGLLVLSYCILNPSIQVQGVIATSPLIGFPKDRKLDFFKLFMIKNVAKKLEVSALIIYV